LSTRWRLHFSIVFGAIIVREFLGGFLEQSPESGKSDL